MASEPDGPLHESIAAALQRELPDLVGEWESSAWSGTGSRPALFDRVPELLEAIVGAVRRIESRGSEARSERELAPSAGGLTRAELARSGSNWAAVLDALPAAVLLVDAKSRELLYANRRNAEIWRIPFAPEAAWERYENLRSVDPETGVVVAARELSVWDRVIAGQVEVNRQVEIVRGDGTRGFILGSAAPLHDASGNVRAAIAAGIDATAQKELEERLVQTARRLDQERERFHQLVDNLDHAVVWEAHADTHEFTFVSARARLLTDFSPDEWHADFFQKQVPAEDRETLFRLFERARVGEADARCNHRLIRKDGSCLWVHTGVHFLPQGDRPLFQGVTIDVTELQNAVIGRDAMLAVVSHDLRSPLASVTMNAAMILRRLDEDGATPFRRAVEAILRGAHKMDRLIGDLLDFASIQAGHLSVTQCPEQLAEVLEDVTANMQPMASEHGITLKLEILEALPLVHCDRERINQVFSNLLSNALKITPAGGTVTVGARGGRDEVVGWVSDTGPGIAPQDLPHVFERFYRSAKAAYKGTGLGLAICRGIVGAHGGRLWVESPPGQGATFYVALPDAVTLSPGGA